jgi:glucose/arabinose dehydrogenase
MTPPVQPLGAHVAPLGVKFYTANKFPEAYRGDVFIAEHGSWNRKEKSGYRITRVKLDGNKAVKYEPFATGFNRGDDVFGRPVDLLMLQDGSMLVSDDTADAIYRITYAVP